MDETKEPVFEKSQAAAASNSEMEETKEPVSEKKTRPKRNKRKKAKVND